MTTQVLPRQSTTKTDDTNNGIYALQPGATDITRIDDAGSGGMLLMFQGNTLDRDPA